MSDFSNPFWNWLIGIASITGILACVWLIMWMTTGNTPKKGERAETMGHVWDEDLMELNNPLPG